MPGANTILIVDDGPGDRRLLEEALREHAPDFSVYSTQNGEQALSYLDSSSQKIVLVFLDLNMPGIDGREVLEAMKKNPATVHIPVIVLTTSEDPGDVEYCYQHHANSVMTKPMFLDDLSDTIGTVVRYWLRTVKIPDIKNI